MATARSTAVRFPSDTGHPGAGHPAYHGGCAARPVERKAHESMAFDYVIVGGGTAGASLANRL
jgi:hypothetical protein